MSEYLNKTSVLNYLKNKQLRELFTQELGWNNYDKALTCQIDDISFSLAGIAEKSGFAIFECKASSGNIPAYNTLKKVSNHISKVQFEHLIIFTDNDSQVWHWVRREGKGTPAAVRQERYNPKNNSGERLFQKLNNLYISWDEEDDFTITEAKSKVKSAFDKNDKITNKFYNEFQKHSKCFTNFIEGMKDVIKDKEWYTSLMLNRLMFIYFIQKQGFLNEDRNYLKNKLEQVKTQNGENKFYSFYRQFLLVLFHKGFSQEVKERSSEVRQLIGKIPYLNGGLFDVHELEKRYPDIKIPDEAFEKIFEFFDEWDWHLDNRPLRKDNEINPDVIGHIFEKYINQKQMGAYYTKEDITEYISRNTVIPFLFDEAKKKCDVAFKPEGYIWQLLKENPDKYIYDAVKFGSDKPLPEEIEQGISDVSKRKEWNKPADEGYALPTEIWREVVERRKRYEEVKSKLQNGEITDINDFITYNLNIRQFAEDVINQAESPDIIKAFYYTIAGHRADKSNQKDTPPMSILDPTCGSGAFLFAALNILESLYEACIERMEAFKAEHPDRYKDFDKVLEEIDKHPNRKYFIYKSIILNNLYGVDIMREAVEIAKLRLFLKLASCAEVREKDDNYGLEPLPDIDFNIRSGNALVGFASYLEVQEAVNFSNNIDNTKQIGMNIFNPMPAIDEKAKKVAMAFDRFKLMQTQEGISHEETQSTKQDLQNRLNDLNEELNGYLVKKYGLTINKKKIFENWIKSHEPFHWFVEFYDVIHNRGGFDVIIGNPPYVEYSKVKNEYTIIGYKTENCGNLYAFLVERSINLIKSSSYLSFIVPLSILSTPRMQEIQDILTNDQMQIWASFYAGDSNPSTLFNGVKSQLCILIASKKINSAQKFSTNYIRWFDKYRPYLFSSIIYTELLNKNYFYKVGSSLQVEIINKMMYQEHLSNKYFLKQGKNKLFYRNASGSYYRLFCIDQPAIKINSSIQVSTTLKEIYTSYDARLFVSLFSSSLFHWFWTVVSDNYHITKKEFELFYINFNDMEEKHKSELLKLADKLNSDYKKNSEIRIENDKRNNQIREVEIYYPRKSKHIIDEIDKVLAEHYGFTPEELDYIINYDIKYRMGKDSEDDE